MSSAKVSGVRTNPATMRKVMWSGGVVSMLGSEADRARYRAQTLGGMPFGSGVDFDRRKVSPRSWVGTSARKGGPKAVERYIDNARTALSQSLTGI